MSAERTKPHPSPTDARARASGPQSLAAALVLAALVLFGMQGFAATPRVIVRSVAALHAGSQPRAVDAVPHRVELQLKREHSWLGLPLVPPAPGPHLARVPSARSDAPALGPGRPGATDLRLSHFRRRIPRMSSEDPPCA